MKRRDFIVTLGGLAAGWSLAAGAQLGRVPRIGILSPAHSEGPDASRPALNALVEGLRELNHIEGRNIVIERRFGEADSELLRKSAAEMVELQLDVIVAV